MFSSPSNAFQRTISHVFLSFPHFISFVSLWLFRVKSFLLVSPSWASNFIFFPLDWRLRSSLQFECYWRIKYELSSQETQGDENFTTDQNVLHKKGIQQKDTLKCSRRFSRSNKIAVNGQPASQTSVTFMAIVLLRHHSSWLLSHLSTFQVPNDSECDLHFHDTEVSNLRYSFENRAWSSISFRFNRTDDLCSQNCSQVSNCLSKRTQFIAKSWMSIKNTRLFT